MQHRPLNPFRLLLAGVAGALLVASVGCVSVDTQTTQITTYTDAAPARSDTDLDRDRAAIHGMAGEFVVGFAFDESMAIRPGYELAEPYRSGAYELVVVVVDEPTRIELQHILVVEHEGEQHIIKHWRQRWVYEQNERYHYAGKNVWQPTTISAAAARGTWTQSVYQVSDEPRYWGTGTWTHDQGVSTWVSDTTYRPLPRRELDRGRDYHVLIARNTHTVTPAGWIHQQHNAKLDLDHAEHPIVALEQGVNTYTRTDAVDFSQARDYWDNTAAYWACVRAAWADLLDERETIALQNRWRGDPMYNHLFDLADEYWGDEACTDAQPRAAEIIQAFTTRPAAD